LGELNKSKLLTLQILLLLQTMDI